MMGFKWWTAFFVLCVAVGFLTLITSLIMAILHNWFGAIAVALTFLISGFIAAGISGKMEDEL